MCYFVSTPSARPLDELAARSRGAQCGRQFRGSSRAETSSKSSANSHGSRSGLVEDDIWAALRRIYLETISEALLQRWNSERISVLIDGQPDKATDVLTSLFSTPSTRSWTRKRSAGSSGYPRVASLGGEAGASAATISSPGKPGLHHSDEPTGGRGCVFAEGGSEKRCCSNWLERWNPNA